MKFVIDLCRSIICVFLVIGLGFFVLADQAQHGMSLMAAGGNGTRENPYRIETAEQFASFRDSVNSGTTYEGCYFLQTKDIDLQEYNPWVPIGEYSSSSFFAGCYDGGGHVLSNLHCDGRSEGLVSENIGLFGQLGGTVMNLGIVSGTIDGDHVGSIASHSYYDAPAPAYIINCFSLADVRGAGRGGGIADNFSYGYIVNCWYDGEIAAPRMGGIASYNAMGIYRCLSSQRLVGDSYTGFLLDSRERSREDLGSASFIHEINAAQNGSEEFFRLEPGTCADWNFDHIKNYR